MIKDTLKNRWQLASTHFLFEKALWFLAGADWDNLASGRYELAGKDLYVLIQHNTLVEWHESQWETHREYLDLQFLARGGEVIGYSPAQVLEPGGEYVVDEQLYKECDGERIEMRPGDFVVFYPEDAHKPGIAPSPFALGTKIIKGVAKIRIAALG